MALLAMVGDIGQYAAMTRMTPLLVRMPAELLAQIDARRGDVPRSVWIRRCCERAVAPLAGAITKAGLKP